MAGPEAGDIKVGEKESCGWLKEKFGMCSNGSAVDPKLQAEAALNTITAKPENGGSLLGNAAESMKPARLENKMKELGI